MHKEEKVKIKKKTNFIEAFIQIPEITIIIFIVLVGLFIGVQTKSFFTVDNFINISKQIAVNGILSIGMMLVIIARGVDLSIGSLLALLCAIAGTLVDKNAPIWIAVPVILAFGALFGFINGELIVKLRVAPIIVTLGTMNIYRGIAYVYSGGKWTSNLPDSYIFLGQGLMPLILLIVIGIIFTVIMRNTRFGRYIYAIGNNEESARLAGIRVDNVKKKIFICTGLLIGIATIVFIGRTGVIQPSAGDGYEMDAIGAAVLGGVSFSGGKGTVLGTILGAVLMGLILNGMTLLKVSADYQGMVTGLLIVLALLLDTFRNTYQERRRKA